MNSQSQTTDSPMAEEKISSMARTTEAEVGQKILEFMSDGLPWTIDRLTKAIRNSGILTSADKERHGSRAREQKWEDRLDNCLGAKRGSLTKKGLVENVGHGEYKITDKGMSEWEKIQKGEVPKPKKRDTSAAPKGRKETRSDRMAKAININFDDL